MLGSLGEVVLQIQGNWGVVSQISHQATTSPSPSDSYAWGFLTVMVIMEPVFHGLGVVPGDKANATVRCSWL